MRLAIQRVTLVNCGPLRGTHVFELPIAGISLWLAGNESGKTTFLESIAAILWGRPLHERCWTAASDAPHRGILEFERSNGGAARRFRVERDFQTHAVRAVELLDDGTGQTVFDGAHNPGGRTADATRWADSVLPTLWASLTRETFREVAMLTQPAPSGLDAALVQSLLAGGAGATAAAAREHLLARFREYSKLSRAAGLSSADARNPGLLEQLAAQAEAARSDLAAAAGRLERLDAARDALTRAEQDMSELSREIERQDAVIAAVERLRALRRSLDAAKETSDRLRAAHAAVRETAAASAPARQVLAEQPAELREATEEQLRGAAASLAQRLDRLREIVAPDDLTRQRRRAEEEYTDVSGWPGDGLARIEQLIVLHGRRESAQRALQAALQRGASASAAKPDRALRMQLLIAGSSALIIGGAVGMWFGPTIGAIAGVVCGLLAAAVTRFVAPPARPPEDPELQASRAAVAEASAAMHQVQSAAVWLKPADAPELARLAERRAAYERALAEIERQSRAADDARAALDAVPLPAPATAALAATQSDLAAARQRLIAAYDALAALRTADDKRRAILATCGVADEPTLEATLQEADDRRVGLRRELDALTASSALVEELAAAPATQLDQHIAAATNARENASRRQQASAGARRDAERELARLEGSGIPNIAALDSQLSDLHSRIAAATAACDAIKIADTLVDSAQRALSTHHRAAVETTLNDAMRTWTCRNDRHVALDEQFNLGLRDGDDQPRRLESLSAGAADQLALAARLAVLRRVAGDVTLPLLLDDPLASCDAERRERILAALAEAAGTHQVILVAHDVSLRNYGDEIRHIAGGS